MAISNSARSSINSLGLASKKQSALGAYDASKASFDSVKATYDAEVSGYNTMLSQFNSLEATYNATDSTKHADRANDLAKQIFALRAPLAASMSRIESYGAELSKFSDGASKANASLAATYKIEERLDQSRSKKTKGVAGVVSPKTSLSAMDQKKSLLGS